MRVPEGVQSAIQSIDFGSLLESGKTETELVLTVFVVSDTG